MTVTNPPKPEVSPDPDAPNIPWLTPDTSSSGCPAWTSSPLIESSFIKFALWLQLPEWQVALPALIQQFDVCDLRQVLCHQFVPAIS